MTTEPSEREEAVERLKRIRQWRRELTTITVEEKQWVDTIDFLLSLLDSQETRARDLEMAVAIATDDSPGVALSKLHKLQHVSTADARSLVCDWRDRWQIPVPDPGTPLDAQSDLIATVAVFGRDAATRMRERCVDRVKELRKEWQTEAEARRDPDNPHDYKGSYGLASGAVDACDDIITAIESLTLEGTKEHNEREG